MLLRALPLCYGKYHRIYLCRIKGRVFVSHKSYPYRRTFMSEPLSLYGHCLFHFLKSSFVVSFCCLFAASWHVCFYTMSRIALSFHGPWVYHSLELTFITIWGVHALLHWVFLCLGCSFASLRGMGVPLHETCHCHCMK